MIKSGIDQQAMIDMFAQASAQQQAQLRKGVFDATLAALQGRELSLKNIRSVLATVAQSASAGTARNPLGDVDAQQMLDTAVSGMDDALLKAVEANRVALQQLVDRGADLRETQMKKALSDLEKFEDMLQATVNKSAGSAADPMSAAWAQVAEKLKLGGTLSGNQAASAAAGFEQQMAQMQTAMREGRAASMRAAQTLADSYTALVSGVLIGMSDALRQAPAKPAKK